MHMIADHGGGNFKLTLCHEIIKIEFFDMYLIKFINMIFINRTVTVSYFTLACACMYEHN